MADPARHLTSAPRWRSSAFPPGRRALAGTLSAVLALGTVLPGAALAGEGDSEGEGSAPPGALAESGEETDFDPGGAATVLEELPAEPVALPGGDALDTGEAPPVGPPPSEVVDPASPEIEATDEEPTSQEEESDEKRDIEDEETTESESAAEPSKEPDPGPAPTPSATADTAPIAGQPLVASASQPEKVVQSAQRDAGAGQTAVRDAVEDPSLVVTSEESEESSDPTPAEPASDSAVEARVGGAEHTVQSGECLWSIAEGVLGAGASDAEIALEVERLWRLNAGRIGTGDPDMLPTGIVLRLR